MKTEKRLISLMFVLIFLCSSIFTIPVSAQSITTEDITDVTANFAGKIITIQSKQNKSYICADTSLNGTPVIADRASASSWETFQVSSLTPDGWVGLKAHNGKYISAVADTQDTPLRATADKLQSWECFRIYQKNSSYFIKAQVNNQWLCVRVDQERSPLQARTSTPSTWEELSIQITDQRTETSTSGAKYTYVTKTLDVSNPSNWLTSLLQAQNSMNGTIDSISVEAHKSMDIIEPLSGPAVNGKTPTRKTTIQAPSRVTFKLHTHEKATGYGSSWRYENGCIVTMYRCNCGYIKDLLVWEIPLPDPSEFVGKQINETIRLQSQNYYWINNVK